MDFKEIKDNYIKHYGFLKQNEAKEVADLFAFCFKGINTDDYNNLYLLLKTQSRYFNLLTDKKSHIAVKFMLIKLLVKDLDNKCGTDYLSRIEEAKDNLKKINFLNNRITSLNNNF